MKRITLIICLVFCCFNLFAQRGFPKSAKEDKEKIMSEAYWNIWNPKVQAKIDKDIEQNRKANAIRKVIVQNNQEISPLTKQRDELLPLLMNGQVSVNSDLSDD